MNKYYFSVLKCLGEHHVDIDPPPLSHSARPLPSCMGTYFMNGPFDNLFDFCRSDRIFVCWKSVIRPSRFQRSAV